MQRALSPAPGTPQMLNNPCYSHLVVVTVVPLLSGQIAGEDVGCLISWLQVGFVLFLRD